MKGSPWETDPTLRRDLRWGVIAFAAVLVVGFFLMFVLRALELGALVHLIGAGVVGMTVGLRVGKALNPDAPRSLRVFGIVLGSALLVGATVVLLAKLE